MKEHNITEGYTKAMMVFIKAAAKYGFKPIKSTGKHLKFVNSAGTRIGAPKTTSDRRSILNFESQARRAAGTTAKPTATQPVQPKATPVPKPTTPTAKQRYEAGEKGLKTGTQTTFKDFMQKVDTARTKAPVAPANAGTTTSTAQRMAQGYDQNIAPVINRRGREVLSSIQRRERLVNKFGSVKEGMLPVPSDKRKRIINPMIAAMPPKTEKGINDAMKKGLDKLDKKMDRMYKDLNSVPKDREKA